ncbi:MAG: alpha/beta hydrolase-fold protein [Kiritimatiellia bacterium]
MKNTTLPFRLLFLTFLTPGLFTGLLLRAESPAITVQDGIHVFTPSSPFLGEDCDVRVLLPDPLEPGKRYRTLYVLPVVGVKGRGEFGDGLEELRKADAHNRWGLIVVAPSFDSVPWYGSHATDPKIRHEQYLKEVVVPFVEKNFPATGQSSDRLLLGFSKSGWGAVSLLLRDPDFWGAACSWDAPLMMDQQKLGWGSARHFGTPEHAVPHLPVTLARSKAAAFTDSPPRLFILGKNIYGKHTREFHDLLTEVKIPHHYDNSLAFKHRWDSGWLPPALELMFGNAPSD